MGITYWAFAKKISDSKEQMKPALFIIGVCIVVALYYLNVVSFAANIYPYIPSYKGGGDYSEMADAIIWFRDNYKIDANMDMIPSELFLNKKDTTDKEKDINISGFNTKNVKIIYDTPYSVYVAITSDSGGPSSWRKGAWPIIYSIRRDSISAVAFYWKTYKFKEDEFNSNQTISDLCNQLSNDNVGISSCDINGLNDILKQPQLYRTLISKHPVTMPVAITTLYEETTELRKKNFDVLKKEEQKKIIELNRKTLETVYPKECPKSLNYQYNK
jgi:hypothetical protein